jgi:hypothetical protein
VPTGRQHTESAPVGARHGGFEEPRLAKSGRALDDERLPLPRVDAIKQHIDLRKLGLALNQLRAGPGWSDRIHALAILTLVGRRNQGGPISSMRDGRGG